MTKNSSCSLLCQRAAPGLRQKTDVSRCVATAKPLPAARIAKRRSAQLAHMLLTNSS